jgi:PAS domain
VILCNRLIVNLSERLTSVAMFRAQLLLEEQRRLYDVWASASGTLSMPTREDFQPRAFGPLLPFISLIEVHEGQTTRVRVVGSALRDVFGSCPKLSLDSSDAPGGMSSIARVARDGRPACGVAPALTASGTGVRFWMRLPLGKDQIVQAVIGLDIALSGARTPDWALQQVATA